MTEIMPVPRNSHITVLRPPSICREILAAHAEKLKAEKARGDAQIAAMLSDSAIPTPRTEEYYKKRPCAEVCATAARLLEEYLHELES